MRPLAPEFVPAGPFDVICSKGRRAQNHNGGNIWFRPVIGKCAQDYAGGKDKSEKSMLVSKIMDIVQHKGSHGGFVRENEGIQEHHRGQRSSNRYIITGLQ